MTDQIQPAKVPTAGVHSRRRIPLVWIVPILTGLIAAWLAWDTFSKRGPTITIAFETAAGLTAGQSQLKYRNVVMGTVKTIAVAPDLSRVLVTVETVREAEELLTDKTIFWVVKPQLFAGNVTGLDTLLSGSYIGMRPTTEKGKPQRSFVGNHDPPVLQASAKGTTFKLATKRLGSISLGSPIFFRDLEAGTVLGWDVGDLASDVVIHAFVRDPYDKYVHEDSSFWNASGLQVKLTASGLDVQFESLRALLLGGIAFDTPTHPKSPVAASHYRFPLYASMEVAKSAGFGRQLQMVSNFEGSVAGLAVGADVTLYGLKIGEVTDVRLVYEPKKDRIVAPVHYRVEADRVIGISATQGMPPGVLAEEMVKRGLRATLQAPSLITGQKIVALEMMPDAPPADLGRDGDVYIVPAYEVGGFDSITRSANELLSKINRIDFDRIGRSISGAAQGLDDTINGPQLKKTLAALEAAMIDVQDIARKLDKDASPALKRLPEIAAQFQDAITKANRLIGSVDQGYGGSSKFHRDLDRLIPQLTDTARSIRALADLLSRHPEALIKGRTNTGKE
ncbi:MAG: MCE family protein [Reyranella sp.]|uniref:PqiB family protein n=1 Tax=Reyranella sp. TaxID=1929291 RepID=UPI0011F40F55|nr:MlaD family protein [Reyranella sp.]TAJ40844.1 MAG: MCE family protein [Reyranella sp.]